MANGFVKATRDDVFAKVLFYGTSGSGKTFSSLRLANGFAKMCGSRIALIDTENGRASYYASEFDFDRLILEAPYSSKKYIDAIDMAIDNGYKVLIIDSLSHEWIWCNEIVNSMPGASGVQKWGKVKQQYHNPFVEKIIQSKIHIFATARGSTKFDKSEDGKIDYKKFTDGIAQDKDTEFNYTATFMLAQDTHIATCTKDNTHLFEDRFVVLTEKDGERLYDWCKSDNAVSATVKTTNTMTNVDEVIAAQEFAKANAQDTGTGAIIGDDPEVLKEEIKTVFGAFRDRATSDEHRDLITQKLYSIVAEHNNGKKNWLKTDDIETLHKILDALNNFKM